MTDPRPSLLPESSRESGLCVEMSPDALMLDLQVSERTRVAFPYSRILSCEWQDADAELARESLSIRFPGCEVRVSGRGLEGLREPLQKLHVARLSVVDPLRVFEAGPIVIESIVVIGADY